VWLEIILTNVNVLQMKNILPGTTGKKNKKTSKLSDTYKVSSFINLCYTTKMYTKIAV